MTKLQWSPFYSISDFNSNDHWKTKSAAKDWLKDHSNVNSYGQPAGVYIYGFIDKIQGKNLFAPYYVGKSRNIYDRLFNHIAGLKGCSLGIYKRQEIFFSDKNFKNNHPLNYGCLSFYRNFLNNPTSLGKEIANEINWMINHFVAAWTMESNAKRREQIEKFVGNQIGEKNLITKIGKSVNGQQEVPDQIKIEEYEDSVSDDQQKPINDENSDDSFKNNKTLESYLKENCNKPFLEIQKESDLMREAMNILNNMNQIL